MKKTLLLLLLTGCCSLAAAQERSPLRRTEVITADSLDNDAELLERLRNMPNLEVGKGIENVVPASDFRASGFDGAYGVLMADGPLAGLLARAVVVIDKAGRVVYTELVPEITEEPDYDKAVEAVKAN